MNKRSIYLFIILSLIGLMLWIGIGKITHSVEAWDSRFYYIIGLPFMCAASAITGYLEPKNPAIIGIAVIILQPVALLFQQGIGPLILVGLLFFIGFAVMTVGSAFLGAAVRRIKE